MLMICKICNKEVINTRKLSKHIRDVHKEFTIRSYYDSFLKQTGEEKCVICSNESHYVNLGVGYNKTCSASCAGKYFRLNLKNNKIRNEIFIEKVKKNMIKEWEKRKNTQEKKDIIDKIKTTKKLQIGKMTTEEKSKKFGWVNKLTEKEKEDFVKKNYWEKLYVYWQNITDEEYQKIMNKRLCTMVEKQKSGYVYHETQEQKEKLNQNLEQIFGIK